jgi:hypothetical protein
MKQLLAEIERKDQQAMLKRRDCNIRVANPLDLGSGNEFGQIAGRRAAGLLQLMVKIGLVTVLRRSPISLCHLGLECERADAAQI